MSTAKQARRLLLRRALSVEAVHGQPLPYDDEGYPDFYLLRFTGHLVLRGAHTRHERQVSLVLDDQTLEALTDAIARAKVAEP